MSVRDDILEAIRLDLNELKNDTDAPMKLAEVILYDQNILELNEYEKPMIMLMDSFGEEEIHTDGTDDVCLWSIGFYGVIDEENDIERSGSLNRLVSTIKRYVKSNPTLSQVYKISYRLTRSRNYKEEGMADMMVEADILYYTESGVY